MSVVEIEAADREYLEMVTRLLQRARQADAEGGLWEAADLQWWWRRDQHRDRANARFWVDSDEIPIGAVIFTDWGGMWGCDVIGLPDDEPLLRSALWPHALDRMQRLTTKPIEPKPIEVAVRDDDLLTPPLLIDAGFTHVQDSAMTCWMPAGSRRAITPIATGYELFSTAQRSTDPHHMVGRSGASVAERLRECSLYDPELDLYVVAPDGDIAAYGMFWADPVTGVGLVEPMRTEDHHQNHGLGRHLLSAGLDRLARHGCARSKVTYFEGNDPARLLYLGAGFQPRTGSSTYRRAASSSE